MWTHYQKDYEKLKWKVKHDPKNINYLKELAHYQKEHMKLCSEAAATYEKILKIDPNNKDVKICLAALYSKYPGMRSKAYDLDPDSVNIIDQL